MERAFTEIGEGMKESLLNLIPNSVKSFVLDTESSYKNLLKEIKEEPKPFIQKVYVIEVPEMLENSHFDAVVNTVNKEF